MKTNKSTALLGVLVLVLGMTFSGSAQATDNSTVTVNVGTQTAIDISPSALNFGTIEPGTEVNETTSGFTHFEVENIGSNNITNVWANTSTPTTDPFGTGFASNYDVGNFIQIQPDNEIAGVASDNSFTYVNRKEYNESNDLSYITTPEGTNQEWRYGRFRVGEQEFFWAVNTTTTGACETGDTDSDDLRVGVQPHNQTATGSVDFTTASEYDSYDLASGTTVEGVASSVTLSSATLDADRTYDVVANCGAETYTYRSKFNPDVAGEDLTATGGAAQYLLSGTAGSAEAFQPGEHFEVNVSVRLPQGVAATGTSETIDGLLRIFGNTA